MNRNMNGGREVTELVEWLDTRIDDVLQNPIAWGGRSAIEPVVLALVMLRQELLDSEHGMAVARRSYRRFVAHQFGPGPDGLTARKELDLEALVDALRSYLAELRVTASSPSKRDYPTVPHKPMPGSRTPIDVATRVPYSLFRRAG